MIHTHVPLPSFCIIHLATSSFPTYQYWIAVYPLDNAIRPLNNCAQDLQPLTLQSSHQKSNNLTTTLVTVTKGVPYLLDQGIGMEIINVQQICPPIMIACTIWCPQLASIPQWALTKECIQIGVKQNDKHVTWGQPVEKRW